MFKYYFGDILDCWNQDHFSRKWTVFQIFVKNCWLKKIFKFNKCLNFDRLLHVRMLNIKHLIAWIWIDRHIICINYIYLTFSCYVNLLERFNNSWSTQYKWVHVTHMLKHWRATPCSAKISEKLSNNAGSKYIATVTSHYTTSIKRNYRHLLLLRCSHNHILVCDWTNECSFSLLR